MSKKKDGGFIDILLLLLLPIGSYGFYRAIKAAGKIDSDR